MFSGRWYLKINRSHYCMYRFNSIVQLRIAQMVIKNSKTIRSLLSCNSWFPIEINTTNCMYSTIEKTCDVPFICIKPLKNTHISNRKQLLELINKPNWWEALPVNFIKCNITIYSFSPGIHLPPLKYC